MALIEISVLFVVIVTIILFVQRKFSYWKNHHVPYETPTFPFGNMGNPLAKWQAFNELVDKFYKHFKRRNEKHFGIYASTKPVYIPMHPDIVKAVMTTDFDHFMDHGFYYNEKDDPLSAHLFSLTGQKWRQMRAKLTPTFTSGKMKNMFSTLIACTKGMSDFIKDKEVRGEPLDIKSILQLFTIDVIGSCTFGIECNSFKSESEIQKYGMQAFAPTALGTLKNLFCANNPELARALKLGFFPKHVSDFFIRIVDETVKYRQTNKVRRNDLIQLLMDLQIDNKMALSFNELAAQAFVFFMAGYETSSTTMQFCLYELSRHPDLQNKVREEIKAVLAKHNNEITYDALMDMKYMQQVIDGLYIHDKLLYQTYENVSRSWLPAYANSVTYLTRSNSGRRFHKTLRLYPAASFIPRECVKDYQVSNTNATIEKGVMVIIPAFSLHRDPEHFEDPEKFDPERFSPENIDKITPFTYVPFGEGPRMCIGLRFGLMQIKVGLATLLRDYLFTLNERTKLPLEWDKFSIVLAPKTPIWLNITKIK